MTRVIWSEVGDRLYETGIDRGVLYVEGPGVVWNGLTSVDESPSGGDAKPFYIDGVKYLNLAAAEEFEATLSAYYSPREFDVCDGAGLITNGLFAMQQRRVSFGLTYRTRLGNDVKGTDFGYKIHIVYNALAAPTQRTYTSINGDPNVPSISWKITTKARPLPGVMRSAYLIVDTSVADPYTVALLEDIIYGTETTIPRLPFPEELADLFQSSGFFIVTDLADELFNIAGPFDAVYALDAFTFQITDDSVTDNGDNTYSITSL